MTTLVRRLARGPLVVALLAVAGIGACGGAPDHPDLFGESAAALVSMRLEDVRFSAPRIEAQSGSLIEVVFVNSGVVDHDFTIRKIDADVSVRREGAPPGAHAHGEASGAASAVHVALATQQEARLRLHLHARGAYEYYCSTLGHREAGMTGVLVVS